MDWVAPLIVAICVPAPETPRLNCTRRSSAAAPGTPWQDLLGYLSASLWFAEPAIGSSTPCTAMWPADSSPMLALGLFVCTWLYHGMFGCCWLVAGSSEVAGSTLSVRRALVRSFSLGCRELARHGLRRFRGVLDIRQTRILRSPNCTLTGLYGFR